MSDQTKKNTENEKENQIDNLNNKNTVTGNDRDIETDDIDDTDKYLAMEQPGVQYTDETDPTRNSDQIDYSNEGQGDEWSEEGGNSKNSDAFNQDDYILEDNVDLDEDQNQSISSDDEDFEESNERYTN